MTATPAAPVCPKCTAVRRQVKDGFTPQGSQRYRCRACGCRYTPEPREQGYSEEMRFQALQLYLDGQSMREIGRTLGVNHQTVANWLHDYARYTPPDLPLDRAERERLETLFVF